jgi:hypothetical protein
MSRLAIATSVALIAVFSVDVASAVEQAQEQVPAGPGVPARIVCSCTCSVGTPGQDEVHDLDNVSNEAACRGVSRDHLPCRNTAGAGQYTNCQVMGVPGARATGPR